MITITIEPTMVRSHPSLASCAAGSLADSIGDGARAHAETHQETMHRSERAEATRVAIARRREAHRFGCVAGGGGSGSPLVRSVRM